MMNRRGLFGFLAGAPLAALGIGAGAAPPKIIFHIEDPKVPVDINELMDEFRQLAAMTNRSSGNTVPIGQAIAAAKSHSAESVWGNALNALTEWDHNRPIEILIINNSDVDIEIVDRRARPNGGFRP